MNNNEDLKLHSILDENIGKFGFADEAGNVVIPCKWRDVGEFSEGLALVADDEMNYGYIDKTGKVVIPCKWADAWEFDNGLARVFDENFDDFLIDKSGNIIDDLEELSEMSFSEGYKLAEKEYSKLTTSPQTSEEWVAFFHHVIQGHYDLQGISGVAAFITSEEIKTINVGQFSKELKSLGKVAEQYGHDTRMVDCLLPRPDDYEENGPAIEIPKDLRPDYHYDSIFDEGTGKLGRIYMQEVGMHMYLPHCDIYDVDDPDTIICEGDQLDSTSVKISELLSVLQGLLDPNKENLELAQAIERCRQYENGGSPLPSLLKKYGIGVVNLSSNGWHRVNYQNIHAEALYVELDEDNHLQVMLQPEPYGDDFDNPFDATEAGFGELSDFIKEALNRARNTQRVK